MKNKHALLLIIIFLLAFTGCSREEEVMVEETPPSPGKETGVVYGYLVSSENEPVSETIYLAQDIAHDQPDLPITVSFSLQSDPRGKVNVETGFFYFDEVEPRENYVIAILAGAAEPVFILEEGTEVPLVIEVEAGEAVDLGTLVVDLY